VIASLIVHQSRECCKVFLPLCEDLSKAVGAEVLLGLRDRVYMRELVV
jgi:hypothetical protein